MPIISQADLKTLVTAEFSPGNNTHLTTSQQAWRKVSLPYKLTKADHANGNSAWFRWRIDGDFSGQAMYIRRHNMAAKIYINKQLLHDAGPFVEPLPRYWNRALVVELKPQWQQTGDNYFYLHLASYPHYGALDPLILGDFHTLKQRYDRAHRIKVVSNQWLFYITLSSSLWVFCLWLQRPSDRINLWFSSAGLCWSIYTLNLIVTQIPIPSRWWDVLSHSALDFWVVLAVGFIHRLLNIVRPQLETAFILFACSGAIVYYLADVQHLELATSIWHSITMLIGLYVLALTALNFYHKYSISNALNFLVFAAIYAAGLYDFLVQTVGPEAMIGIRLIAYPAPFLTVYFASILTLRFAQAHNQAQQLRQELDQRVVAATLELEQLYANAQIQTQLEALNKQRHTILTTLHQSVGLKLQRLSHSATPQVAQSAHASLLQLNRTVSSSADMHQPLYLLLPLWHTQAQQRSRLAGFELAWSQQGDFKNCFLSSEYCTQLQHILQELLSNTLKHSHGSKVEVNISVTDSVVLLRYSDNGAHFTSGNPGSGMANIQQRTELLGGICLWQATRHGSCNFQLKIIHKKLANRT